MTPLLFAAALALMPPSQHPLDGPNASPLLKDLPRLAAGSPVRSFVLKDLPARDCSQFAVKTAWSNGGKATKLADLPPGLLEHAVLRSIHGCPVREIMYAGGTYYLGVPDTGVEPVSPAVSLTAPPVKDR
jgi:hypothetical protein